MDKRAEVSIERFYLHGDSKTRVRLLDSLEQQDWPSTDPRRVYIIRRVEVQGAWWEVAAKARETVCRLYASALHVDAAGAQAAEAIYFASQSEFVAALLADKVANRLSWYWSNLPQWRQPTAELITASLNEHLLLLPAIVAELERRQSLQPVLAELSAEACVRLLEALACATGWQGLKAGPVAVSKAESVELSEAAVSSWRELIGGAGVSARPWLLRLAAVVSAWGQRPQVLNTAAGLQAWQAGVEKALGLAPNKEVKVPVQNRAGGIPPGPSDSKHKVPVQNAQDEQPAEVAQANAPMADKESGTDATARLGIQQAETFEGKISAESGQPEEHSKAAESFITRCGGFFYLINILARREFRDWLADLASSPWEALWHLGRALGAVADAPLCLWLAEQLNLDTSSPQASLEALTLPPDLDARLEDIRRLYGERRFQGESLDFSAAMNQPAQVCSDAADIQVIFHRQSVNLAWRLAGLDIDPGWQPWLGRVVRFHYEDVDALPPLLCDGGFRGDPL